MGIENMVGRRYLLAEPLMPDWDPNTLSSGDGVSNWKGTAGNRQSELVDQPHKCPMIPQF
jgi:hypothetical protein